VAGGLSRASAHGHRIRMRVQRSPPPPTTPTNNAENHPVSATTTGTNDKEPHRASLLGSVATPTVCTDRTGNAANETGTARKGTTMNRTSRSTHRPGDAAVKENPRMRRRIVRLATTVLVSGGLGLAGLGLGAGTAQAIGGPYQWCPGKSMWISGNHVTNPVVWDESVCHTYYMVDFGKGNVAQNVWDGPNPPADDPIQGALPNPLPGMCWDLFYPVPCPPG